MTVQLRNLFVTNKFEKRLYNCVAENIPNVGLFVREVYSTWLFNWIPSDILKIEMQTRDLQSTNPSNHVLPDPIFDLYQYPKIHLAYRRSTNTRSVSNTDSQTRVEENKFGKWMKALFLLRSSRLQTNTL